MIRPWMPLYVADYLADTAHLEAAESGAYLHLIMHYWINGGLPNDDRRLARIAKMADREWLKSKATIQDFFDDGWRHGRIEFEMTEAARISEAGRRGGQASGAARRAKSEQSPNDKRTTIERPLNDITNDPPTNGEALHSPSPKLEASASSLPPQGREKKSRRKASISLPLDWRPSEADRSYASSLGLTEVEIGRETERFTNHARSNDRRLSDWSMGWRNWALKAAEFLQREPPRLASEECATSFHAEPDSDELVAWEEYRMATEGKSWPRDKLGGWTFPTQWPPGYAAPSEHPAHETTQ